MNKEQHIFSNKSDEIEYPIDDNLNSGNNKDEIFQYWTGYHILNRKKLDTIVNSYTDFDKQIINELRKICNFRYVSTNTEEEKIMLREKHGKLIFELSTSCMDLNVLLFT